MNPSTSLRPNRRFISPRARRALAARGLDITALNGSGPNGRILEADVQQAAPTPRAPQSAGEAAPFFTLRAEADAAALLALHKRFGDHAVRGGASWTPADFLICAVAKALRAYPDANRVWQSGAATDAASQAVGVFDGEEPRRIFSIRDEGGLNLLEAARQRQTGESVSENEAAPAITIFDASRSRADVAEPPPMPHGGASLGMGRIAARPFVVNGELGVRSTFHLTLRVDARLWSANLAANFLDFLVEYVEEPHLLVFG